MVPGCLFRYIDLEMKIAYRTNRVETDIFLFPYVKITHTPKKLGKIDFVIGWLQYQFIIEV